MGWVGGDVPNCVLSAVDAVKKAAPRCTVMFHIGDDVIPDRWREVASSLRPQMRSDIQRHAILQRHGGLWLDIDVTVLRDPADWAEGWTKYTAIRVGDDVGFIGTDIIYVPNGWSGWPVIDEHIDHVLEGIATTKRVKMLALASRMIERCQKQIPDAFDILNPGEKFPFSPELLSSSSVVARSFTPAPGLGDMMRSVFSAVGVTEERVSRLIGRPCGCGKRAAKFNLLGHKYLGLPPGKQDAT